MVKMGSAGMLSTMGQWWSWEIAAGMAGVLGETSLAAHSCIANLGFFYFPVPFAVSTATTVSVGNSLGAGKPAAAR